jgi:hypothetical protein
MIATVFAVVVAHPTRSGRAATVDRRPHRAAPLVLALFADRQRADARLVEVACRVWDEDLAYGLGPSGGWDPVKLVERMREEGYLLTVTEQRVEL